MKLLRSIVTLTLLTGLALCQMPQPAQCQMGMSVGIACPIRCCKTMPMSSHCPKIQAQAPHDVITASPISFTPVLHILGVVTSILTPPSTRPSFLTSFSETARWLFLQRPTLGRAPPPDVPLLSA